MKVKKLKKILASLDDESDVVLSLDEKGGNYRTLEDIYWIYSEGKVIFYPSYSKVKIDEWMKRKL